MSIPGSASPLFFQAASAAAAPAVATKSLRFSEGDQAYLNRTPSSAGNRKTYTLSFWVKKSKISDEMFIFAAKSGGGRDGFRFEPGDTFRVFFDSANDGDLVTSQVFRDPSAWYHFVIAVDTTQSTAANRVKIYVNGAQIQDFSTETYPVQNYTGEVNNTDLHRIGSDTNNLSNTLEGYLADFYLIDGSQLDATSFGAFDTNGVWQASTFSGTFGTNGFHLKFDDTSSNAALGTDSSGNSNTFTVNNLTHTAGVLVSGGKAEAVSFDGVDDSLNYSNDSDLEPSNGNFTLECFVYRHTGQISVYYGQSSGNMGIRVKSNGGLSVERRAVAFDLTGNANDVPENQWSHIAVTRHAGTMRTYVNGVNKSTVSNTQTYTGTFSSGKTPDAFDKGAVASLHFVKGTALYTGSGSFTPPTTISSHSNTKLLCCQSASSATAATVKPSGVTISTSGSPTAGPFPQTTGADVDVLFDVPTNGDQSDTGAGGEVSANYPTLSPIDNLDSGVTLSNGNLHAAVGSGTSSKNPRSTIYLNSGKWYWEMTVYAKSTFLMAGIATSSVGKSGAALNQTGGYGYGSGGNYYAGSGSVSSSSPATFTTNDVIGVKWDADAGTLEFFKNNTSQGTISSIPSDYYSPAFTITSYDDAFDVNFGQRAFVYSAPTNHKPICTATLPTPTIADGSTAFEARTYDGVSGASSQTGYNFGPDLVWIKRRNSSNNHTWTDIVRGAGYILQSHNSNQQIDNTAYFTAFTSDGYSFGTDGGDTDESGGQYAAWAWDAGTSTVSNTDGSITTSLRVNQTAGFSIAVYSFNNNNGNQTLGHGLGVIPDIVIRKDTNVGDPWSVYSKAMGYTQRAFLNTTAAWSGTTTFGSSSATNTVNRANNMNSGTYVDYSFASVSGFSSFGTYEGNGSTDGPFVYTGFRPAFIIVKGASSGGSNYNWALTDTARSVANVANHTLAANLGNPESYYGNGANAFGPNNKLDILSNGFKPRESATFHNLNGVTYVYMAWAENPFQANGGLAR